MHCPDCLEKIQDKAYDFLLIAVNSQKAVKSIYRCLEEMGVNAEKIKWLREEFIREDYFILDAFA